MTRPKRAIGSRRTRKNKKNKDKKNKDTHRIPSETATDQPRCAGQREIGACPSEVRRDQGSPQRSGTRTGSPSRDQGHAPDPHLKLRQINPAGAGQRWKMVRALGSVGAAPDTERAKRSQSKAKPATQPRALTISRHRRGACGDKLCQKFCRRSSRAVNIAPAARARRCASGTLSGIAQTTPYGAYSHAS